MSRLITNYLEKQVGTNSSTDSSTHFQSSKSSIKIKRSRADRAQITYVNFSIIVP